MSTENTSQFAKPHIDARALLGLYDPADTTDWAPIRAAQVHAGGQLALFLLAANVIGAAMVTLILQRSAPLWALACWGAVVAAISVAITFRRLAAKQRGAATLAAVRDTVIEGIALATIWSVPPLAFGFNPDVGTALGLWIVLSVLMTASAVAMAALPLATLSFLGILGLAISVMVLRIAGPVLAASVALFTTLLMIGCFTRARSLVLIRSGEIALAERDETVSLLLREAKQDESADWLWETDAARRVVRASPRFALSVGLDPVGVNGKSLLEVLAGKTWDSGSFAPALRTLAENLKGRTAFRGLVLPVNVAEQERWYEIAANPRYDEHGAFLGFRGVGADVTEQRASADKINRMARFDTLTGLPNRLHVNEALSHAMADAEKWGSRCAFMMIDLDRFKAVNDTLGHPIGDRLLSRVAERLTTLMGANEVIGRLGGDEFAVVVRDASDTQRLETLAQTIVDALARPYDIDHHTLYTGASVGVATGPRDGRTTEMLIRSADLALYRSKDAGGGKFHHYEPQLHVAAEERRVLEQALRKALTNDELHLTYQPVVDAGSGRLTGFEALVRWTHPELGPISPVKFIPLAEDARLIAPIGEWVLRSACAEAAKWPGDARVAVNVSPEQLHNPGFVAVVASALANSGLPARRLELEVTESVFMRDDTGAVKVLERILDLGVRLSLDDFGTGYSSLGYLSRTRFSTIKIDRSFVISASKKVPEAIAIIRAVVALAQSLGMATTAEGVETEDEHLMVQELGCTKVQGYYFGRPLPVEEARVLAARAAQNREAA
ncbi:MULTISPECIES: putative bifunctional diguanylate cyclase/phosphodiesterase [unclassified Sphingomonas]|uniref:putative bifunctional diguanylate cyclase/phosphodiesterase n=1 Tax=unclassified Sphingomonas TaxID=196159 RepID=UPI002AB3FB3F|nr:EAL domain-containing protein [Sphingomonas sp. 10B4]MDY7523273.1 EAL domain-containing protein [Sphingomonas sp. 10B4]MEB0283521.1 EAL domain-containing protein [Sphingomonas sp. 10B4]